VEEIKIEELFQQVSFITPFIPTVMEYVKDLKKTDKWSVFQGKCPKCDKDTFLVELVKRAFFCSSCLRSGDIINLVAQMRDISPKEAMDYLIDKYNLKGKDNGSNIT
jgi:DNA primase